MRDSMKILSATALVAALVLSAIPAAAQTGRIGGTVKDETGQPAQGRHHHRGEPKGVAASLHRDDRRQGPLLDHRPQDRDVEGHRAAPGFAPESGGMNVQTIGAPNPPLTFTLKQGGGAAPVGALGGVAAKDLQADLAAADQLYNAGSGTARSPPTARSWRRRRRSAYQRPDRRGVPQQEGLRQRHRRVRRAAEADPNNEKAMSSIGMTNLEKGDLKAEKRR